MENNDGFERIPLEYARDFEHTITLMSEGFESVRAFLENLSYIYDFVEYLDEYGLELESLTDDANYSLYELDYYYEKLKNSIPELGDLFESREDLSRGEKLRLTTMLALEKMNMRGLQIDYAYYDYCDGNLLNLLESLSEPVCQKRLIMAVNINSAKHGFDELAVENKYPLKNQHPKLTPYQLTWYPNLPEMKFLSKEQIELRNKKQSEEKTNPKLTKDDFRIIK